MRMVGGPFDGREMDTIAPRIVFPTWQEQGIRSDEYLAVDRDHAEWYRAYSHVCFESDETIAYREAFLREEEERRMEEFADMSFS